MLLDYPSSKNLKQFLYIMRLTHYVLEKEKFRIGTLISQHIVKVLMAPMVGKETKGVIKLKLVNYHFEIKSVCNIYNCFS